jgi:SAM-dependent methyltransferase
MPPSVPLAGLLRDPSLQPERVGGVPAFLPADRIAELKRQQDSHGENGFKDFFKRWPGVYGALVWLVGPSFFTGLTPGKFVARFKPAGTVLHAGSGTRILPGDCLNVDLFPFPGVDALADLEALPFKDGAFSAVTCDQVLEHVPRPAAVAAELERVTESGGLIHVASPFVFPWHPSPSDYTRWTREGLVTLFPGCDAVESGVMAGPCSALTALLAAFFATLFCFGSRTVQSVLQYLFLVVFSPIKFCDLLLAHMPGAELCSANFYAVVRKR